jgi:hypothetical protein
MRMTRRGIVGALAALTLAWTSTAHGAEDDRKLDEHTQLGSPLSHKNLTLVPILALEVSKDQREYLTLDEAFAQKVVRVRELTDESVNQLSLQNLSRRPLFVMSGEVILGGKQDRIIGKDRLIPPKQTLVVDVFCVEHGRWTEEGDSREFRSAKVMAHTSLRLKASYDSQSDVWDEVASKNTQRKSQNDTDTYRAVAADKRVAKDIRSYADYFGPSLAKLPGAERLVGFVVVMNGKLVGVEAFGSPKLFGKLRDKLLRSYYVEAIDLPAADAQALAYVPSAEDVREFVARPVASEEQVIVDDKKAATQTKQKRGSGVSATSVVDESVPAASEVYKSAYYH